MALAVVLLAAVSIQAGDGKWFDMEKCAMCQSVANKPELMQQMKWETAKISNGVAMIYVVPANMLADYRALNKDMELKAKRIQQGEKMALCGFCTNYMSLMQKGATREYVPTSNGGLALLTASDMGLQKQLWAFQDRTEKEFQAMMAQQGEKDQDGHEGHSH